MNGTGNIKILVVDDHLAYRKTLQLILQSKSGIEVVGEAENGQDAIEKAMQLHPDVVLMDVRMPVLSGIDATREIKKVLPETIVIALSSDSDDLYIQHMMKAGTSIYLTKDANPGEIESTIWDAFSRRPSPAI